MRRPRLQPTQQVVDHATQNTSASLPVAQATPSAVPMASSSGTASSFQHFRRRCRQAAASPSGSAHASTPSSSVLPETGACSMCEDSADASQGHTGRRAGCKAPCCSSTEELLAGKFSRLSSPSNVAPSSSKSIVPKPIPLTALAQFDAAEHGIVNFQNGTSMAKEHLKLVKIQQRDTCNLYKTSVFFPTASSSKAKVTDEERCERTSLAVASSYICDGNYKCTCGDCMKAFQSSDVLAHRMQAMRSRSASKQTMREFLEANLNKCYNRSDETWGNVAEILASGPCVVGPEISDRPTATFLTVEGK